MATQALGFWVASAMKSRGQSGTSEQEAAVAQALEVLEADGGVADPALSPKIEGKWRLIYTSKSSFDMKNVRADICSPSQQS